MNIDDLNSILDRAIDKLEGFPGIDYRFTTMNDYINEISEFLELTYAQKIERLKARVANAVDPVEKGELEAELYNLEDNGPEYLSHTMWGGVLISIFGTYESSIQELLSFFEETQGKPKFKREARKSFVECADLYSREYLKTRLYRDQTDKLLIDDLLKLRNSYVHNGCSIILLPARLQDAIIDKKYKDYSLGVKSGKWLANAKNSKLYFKYVHESFLSYRGRLADLLSSNNA